VTLKRPVDDGYRLGRRFGHGERIPHAHRSIAVEGWGRQICKRVAREWAHRRGLYKRTMGSGRRTILERQAKIGLNITEPGIEGEIEAVVELAWTERCINVCVSDQLSVTTDCRIILERHRYFGIALARISSEDLRQSPYPIAGGANNFQWQRVRAARLRADWSIPIRTIEGGVVEIFGAGSRITNTVPLRKAPVREVLDVCRTFKPGAISVHRDPKPQQSRPAARGERRLACFRRIRGNRIRHSLLFDWAMATALPSNTAAN